MRIYANIPCQEGDAFVCSLCNRLDIDDILRQPSPSLFSAALIDRVKMLSPRTWWGMIDLESKKGVLSSFDISTTARSAKGLLLPFLILFLLRLAMVRRSQSASTIPLPRLLIPLLVSPWCLQCVYQLFYQLSIALGSFRTMTSTQSLTLSRATNALKWRILSRRAYRTRRYDVYLPPSLGNFPNYDTDTDTDSDQAALLFIPGATVAHEAYSEVAARLSDKGFVVAVMSLEPFRLANRHFGANLSSVKRIIKEITNKIHRRALEVRPPTPDESKQQDKHVLPAKTIEWTLMGHSMGAFGAMQLLRTFRDYPWKDQQTLSRANSTMRVTSTIDISMGNKLVLWGVAAFVESATDLSDLKDAEILIIQGTNDVLVDLMRSKQAEFQAFFPPTTVTERIAGGTHEGFGSYQPSFELENDDGRKKKRFVSLDQQHKRACDETVRFLRSRSRTRRPCFASKENRE